MLCHAHLTFSSDPEKIHGWKPTSIILENNTRQQTDVMYTRHFRISDRDHFKSIDDIFTICKDIPNIIRLKIEKTTNFDETITPSTYIEAHCKINEQDQFHPHFHSWVRSKNPNSKNQQGVYSYFVNKRFYNGTSHDAIASINKDTADIDFLELKIEQVVYDSNTDLDRWWA